MILEKMEKMKFQIVELKKENSQLKTEHGTCSTESGDIYCKALGDGLDIAFTSYLNHDEDGIGENQVFVFNKVILNDGNGYNMHTGVFTAPLTGVYHFDFFIGEREANQMFVMLTVNGSKMVDGVAESVQTTHDIQGGNAANLKLAKADVVFVKHVSGWGGSHIEGSESERISTFSGFL